MVGVKKTKERPAVSYSFGPMLHNADPKHEHSGRIIILEFTMIIVVCLYVPCNTMNNPHNIEQRKAFDEALTSWLRNQRLVSGKQVVVMGDMNVVKDANYTTKPFDRWHEEALKKNDCEHFTN